MAKKTPDPCPLCGDGNTACSKSTRSWDRDNIMCYKCGIILYANGETRAQLVARWN